ncbi:MAG: zinc carboxypeptidase [Cyclobacteriaceae bacterium]|nr:zinc carboxypeptidase [Cyclobacteriaceae bacterium SS2]
MIMRIILYQLLLFHAFISFAQVDLSYYLPKGMTYNPEVSTPKEVIGFHPGEWHVGHDQLVYYMRSIANSSSRVIMEEFARTYENRPLVQLIITSEANHVQLEEIRSQHVLLSDPARSGSLNTESMPIVIWLGYSVHGNEASGANASLLTAYHLAAGQGAEIDELLENAVVIIDPSFNPDGLNRFSSWVNSHRSHVINPDPNDREYDEAWPGGRTNHYWFDLNRDWLPLAHPESRGRIQRFHDWKPNILTDHHEMGTNSTFFFQPGIPSRKYPWTPEKNVELTQKMATFHAKYLDEIGSLYYSRESYDDFYIGKGSTYPDINGSVGVLFEQASSRGHAQENPFGILTFPMAIRNHFTTSLSTLASGIAHRKEFLDFQREFYAESSELASQDRVKAYVFGSEKDPVRNYELLKVLTQHQIRVYDLKSSVTKNGKQYQPGSAYVVPLNQPQYRMVRGIFETRTSFNDSLFYDVSTWTFPLAYNLNYTSLEKEFNAGLLGEEVKEPRIASGKLIGQKGAYAYAIKPHGYYAFRAANRLLEQDVVVLYTNEVHSSDTHSFPRGTMIIPVGIQQEKRAAIESMIDRILEEDMVDVFALTTGLAKGGVDLGSRSHAIMELPKVAVLVEDGISAYEAGEVWHLFDQRLKMKVTLLPVSKVNGRVLARYNRIVIPNGNLSAIRESGKENLKTWVRDGGVIITWKNPGQWLSLGTISNVKYDSGSTDEKDKYKPYEDLDENRGAQVTGGAIFEAKVDLSHPLAYGLENDRIPLFRNHNLVMQKSSNEYANPLVYTSEPLLSGYVSEENLARIKNSPAVTVSTLGSGRIITFTDNPNFRAYWWGTNKLFMNALYYGKDISSGAGE